MKALSLTQPWASLVAFGEKQFETRSWSTSHRGLLAIHASATFPTDAQALLQREPFMSAIQRHYGFFAPLEVGVVLGIVYLAECVPTLKLLHLNEPERSFGNFLPGRYAFRFENPLLFRQPIPVKGHLGIWNWDEDIGPRAKMLTPYKAARWRT